MDVIYQERYSRRYHDNRWAINLTRTQKALLAECRRRAALQGYDGLAAVVEFEVELEALCKRADISPRAAQEAFAFGVMPWFVQVVHQYVPNPRRGGRRQIANLYRVRMTDPVHPDDVDVPSPPPVPRQRKPRPVPAQEAPEALPVPSIDAENAPPLSHYRPAYFGDMSLQSPKDESNQIDLSLIVVTEENENETKTGFNHFVDREVQKIEELTRDNHSQKGFSKIIRAAFAAGKGRYVADALEKTRYALQKAAKTGEHIKNAGAYFMRILTNLLADAEVYIIRRKERSEQAKIRQVLKESIPVSPPPVLAEPPGSHSESRQDATGGRSAPKHVVCPAPSSQTRVRGERSPAPDVAATQTRAEGLGARLEAIRRRQQPDSS